VASASRWCILLDPDSSVDARDQAWRALREQMRPAILFQLRRRIEGYRLTEDLADEVCERVRERYEGRSDPEARILRACIERELRLFLEEHGSNADLDGELFQRDWASRLLENALYELRRMYPDEHLLLMRIYDRPEGAPPLSAIEIAMKLDQPVDDVGRRLASSRADLRRLFEEQIGQTVAEPGLTAAEADLLMPMAEALFAESGER
jgi:DNA-directed RNA polymerase specialized sigma24 family protein